MVIQTPISTILNQVDEELLLAQLTQTFIDSVSELSATEQAYALEQLRQGEWFETPEQFEELIEQLCYQQLELGDHFTRPLIRDEAWQVLNIRFRRARQHGYELYRRALQQLRGIHLVRQPLAVLSKPMLQTA